MGTHTCSEVVFPPPAASGPESVNLSLGTQDPPNRGSETGPRNEPECRNGFCDHRPEASDPGGALTILIPPHPPCPMDRSAVPFRCTFPSSLLAYFRDPLMDPFPVLNTCETHYSLESVPPFGDSVSDPFIASFGIPTCCCNAKGEDGLRDNSSKS